MRWEPADVIKLVALVGALLLLLLGAFMMWQGISTEGSIDIKSSLLSGSIETGSAGLFVAFLGFCIAVFALLAPSRRGRSTSVSAKSRPKSVAIGRALAVLVLLVVLLGALAAAGYGSGYGIIAAFLGFLIIPVGVAYITFLEEE